MKSDVIRPKWLVAIVTSGSPKAVTVVFAGDVTHSPRMGIEPITTTNEISIAGLVQHLNSCFAKLASPKNYLATM
jgi:hypothetical protein